MFDQEEANSTPVHPIPPPLSGSGVVP